MSSTCDKSTACKTCKTCTDQASCSQRRFYWPPKKAGLSNPLAAPHLSCGLSLNCPISQHLNLVLTRQRDTRPTPRSDGRLVDAQRGSRLLLGAEMFDNGFKVHACIMGPTLLLCQ